MADKIKLSDLNKTLADYGVEALQGVSIEGDIEIEIDAGAGGVGPLFAYYFGQEVAQIAVQLVKFARTMGYPVDALLAPAAVAQAVSPAPADVAAAAKAIPEWKVASSLAAAKFQVGTDSSWKFPIQEVTLGATKADGGSRGHALKIGGEKALPFFFDAAMPNKPLVTMDVFDTPIGMAKAVKMHYEDVINSPGEWAKKAVKQFGADMVTVHLISTDPLLKDTPAKEAAKTVEEVLQAVDVPICIGGSGNPDKDPDVLTAAAEVAQGERALIASANLNMDWERIGKACVDNGHVCLAWTQLEINSQKELNRKLMKVAGVPRESIVMDPTTAALAYGMDFAYTNMERIRLGALKGDEELTFPMSSGTTNAWGVRESWMVRSPNKEDSDWGDRMLRGPIWEILTGFSLAMAGVDIFMMMHPQAVAYLHEITQSLMGLIEAQTPDTANWIKMEV
ncbi:MAG: Acetyl-CoA decarbonylase/synthase complex subunit delta 1 [Methanosaeta sp. PtaB.Bin039]|nr:MAG: Acetyl-CoA decarbonylase/synthase complex subunit delta 1 [Methanosaeta sp. PtaB.Bin039]HOT08020.1 CO dehydrogenase/acetyl-CoA synthase subunit delta [Methanotrichaceae archaeon]HQF17446.1 CO dehydrogenase/acetyl-CoA synthase subunit delta [Methanotrichaceae archaeon]HQI92060.1 CO dehydrogenase/acetyl-CoA synthase subunit delta [Methanotrichaceae archaeon]HQJ29443.1 CO dehydrogenase/acetyl-CoA synthase subunit delta [Methanotrichaceae archaeon]